MTRCSRRAEPRCPQCTHDAGHDGPCRKPPITIAVNPDEHDRILLAVKAAFGREVDIISTGLVDRGQACIIDHEASADIDRLNRLLHRFRRELTP